MQLCAALLRQANQPLRIERVKVGEWQPNDVLVGVKASGLCHTDL